MSWTVFNIISTGSDLNAGSTTGNSALVTDVGGTYNQGTGAGGTDRYTASSGTPFSATVVGEYVSIYTAAAAATTFVGQVTAINAGGASIDISLTIIYGTRPANASTKTAKTGGAWASLAAPAALGSTVPQSTQIAIKAATYTLGAATTLALVGTTTKPVWYRGYNTTIGDLDNGSTSLSYPVIDGGANLLTFSTAFPLVTGISFTAARSGPTVTTTTAGPHRFRHCRFANTSSNSAAASFSVAVNASVFTSCYFTTPATANQIISSSSVIELYDCFLDGAGSGTTQVGLVATNGVVCVNTTFNKTGSHAITMGSAGTFLVFGCTFNGWASGGDGIRFTTVPTAGALAVIRNCAFFICLVDINNTTGTNSCTLEIANNLSYAPVTGHLVGIGDWFEMGNLAPTSSPSNAALVDTNDPRTSTTDLHLIPSSVGANAGLPQQWENLTAGLTSTPDVGAWQRTVTGGGNVKPFPSGQIMGL